LFSKEVKNNKKQPTIKQTNKQTNNKTNKTKQQNKAKPSLFKNIYFIVKANGSCWFKQLSR